MLRTAPVRTAWVRAAPGATVRVLLIDDSHDSYLLARQLVGASAGGGYDLDRVSRYDQGLAALRQGNHAVCLLDYRLGARTGLELLREAQLVGVTMPIILLTRDVSTTIENAAFAAGAVDVVLKGQLEGSGLGRALRHAVERQRALTTLHERDLILRAVFDESRDAIVIADDQGIHVDGNQAALELLGIDRARLLSSRITDFLPAEARASFVAGWAQFLRAGGQEGELELLRPDGERRVVDSRGKANVLPNRHFTILRDISETRSLRERLAISDRMASVGTLAAGVAHEINNPLAAIIGNLSVATEFVSAVAKGSGGPTSIVDAVEALRDAEDAAQRVAAIVRDLTMFSRHDAEVHGPVDVLRPLEAILRMVSNEVRHRARLVKDLAPVPSVDANEGRLGQVFLNLLVNAAQAIPEGRAEQNEIRVITREQAGRVIIEVSDTGSGIAPEQIGRIFEPFFTTKPQGKGTGLGLPICRGILDRIGGEITVESEVGKGTTFRVSLPMGVTRARACTSEPGAELIGRPARILVIDDEALLVKLVERTLGKHHQVVGTCDAREALARIRAGERYDLILCDLMMPEITGMDFHQQLGEIAPEELSKVVFLTGGAFTPKARAFVDDMPNRCLEKPFRTDELVALVRDLVQ